MRRRNPPTNILCECPALVRHNTESFSSARLEPIFIRGLQSGYSAFSIMATALCMRDALKYQGCTIDPVVAGVLRITEVVSPNQY
jgi:hypothetical protein